MAQSPDQVSLFSVLRAHPRFARLWLGALISGLGDTLTWLALIWFVLDQTTRGDLVGVLLLCYALPAVVAGPLWGRANDRFQPRRLMIADNILRAGVVGLLPLLAALGRLDLWMIFAVATLAGALSPATQIGVRLLIRALLDDRELEQGNAAYGLTTQIPTVVGPALAGALVAQWGALPALALDAGSFVVMALALIAMPDLPRGEHSEAAVRVAGFRSWPPTVLAILGLTALFYFAYGPLEVALPVHARQRLAADALGYGTLWSALGVGTLLGTLLVGRLSVVRRQQHVLVSIMALWGLMTMLLAMMPTLGLALVTMFLGGVIWGPYTALETTLLQRLVDDRIQGRLFGLRSMLLGPAAPLGTAVGGLLLIGLPAGSVIAGSGMACIAGAALAWLLSRRENRWPVAGDNR